MARPEALATLCQAAECDPKNVAAYKALKKRHVVLMATLSDCALVANLARTRATMIIVGHFAYFCSSFFPQLGAEATRLPQLPLAATNNSYTRRPVAQTPFVYSRATQCEQLGSTTVPTCTPWLGQSKAFSSAITSVLAIGPTKPPVTRIPPQSGLERLMLNAA